MQKSYTFVENYGKMFNSRIILINGFHRIINNKISDIAKYNNEIKEDFLKSNLKLKSLEEIKKELKLLSQ